MMHSDIMIVPFIKLATDKVRNTRYIACLSVELPDSGNHFLSAARNFSVDQQNAHLRHPA